MPKYYRIEMDDFESLPFGSDMDEGGEGHAMVIEEQFKEEFIAEQVGRFTRHLLSIINEMPTRGEHNPFNCIASKYPREHSYVFGNYIVCPTCCTKLDEEGWNTNADDMSPCCPCCGYEFEMEEEEE